jgi:hypothetical protein
MKRPIFPINLVMINGSYGKDDITLINKAIGFMLRKAKM